MSLGQSAIARWMAAAASGYRAIATSADPSSRHAGPHSGCRSISSSARATVRAGRSARCDARTRLQRPLIQVSVFMGSLPGTTSTRPTRILHR